MAKNPTVEFNSIEVRIVRQIFFSREADGFESASLEGVSTILGYLTLESVL